MRATLIAAALLVAACSSNPTPPANTAEAQFVQSTNTIQVKVSDTKPASSALLVGPNGATYPATGINVSQTPYTVYNPAPTFGFGIGSFNDRIRDGIRGGSPFTDERVQGFATGLATDSSDFSNQSTVETDQHNTLLHNADWIRVGLTGNLRTAASR